MNRHSHSGTAAIALFMLAACGSSGQGDGSDTPQIPEVNADSVAQVAAIAAAEMRDSAKATLATLLDNPATATFDSVVVIQPPEVDGRMPSPAVCGRIGGTPGVGGARTPVRFIYQSKWTVFVEEAANREKFAELWGDVCTGNELL